MKRLSRYLQIEHSPGSYRTDFAVHAVTVALMAIYLITAAPPARQVTLGLAAWLAAIGWSLLEYVLHRFVLHGIQPFKGWHAAHHSTPRALICTPIVLSATLIATLVFLPAWLLGDRWLATALTFGLLAGYLMYTATHHAIHHWRADGIWIRQRKHCHALHHDPGRPAGYYGVTSRLWDDVMGTAHRRDF
ncbi:MAG: hypothetical protein RI907_3667 [Pseudomonadota bacterium]|jgi:cyclopropane-fatty-acyl-phospholipid synthase